MANKQAIEPRFWAKVTKTSCCWHWTSARSGGLSGDAYGLFWVGGKKRSEYAHRVSYEMHKGPIPRGLLVMHSCDNPLCVNPEHLFVGTAQDNANDASNKNRLAYGERNGGGGKLTDNSVRRIKALEGVMSCVRVAKALKIAKPVVLGIWNGRGWRRTPNNLKMALA